MPPRSSLPRICFSVMALALLGADDTARGDRLRDAYFQRETQRIATASLADIKTRADWDRQRPELRRQFLSMLGLWTLPARTNLKSVVTGKVETDWYTVEKVVFQSLPGLYVTGNLYLPRKVTQPAATILYLCGHSPVFVDQVSMGNKVAYQHHGAWFAEHGYVCLVIDTLQLGEIPGLHHGTHYLGMWWWQTRGYTPAGIECWNAMRALDYLETRREVDPRRIGVTGRSGGGATTWFLAAADERPQCIVPVAGIADLQAYIYDGERGRLREGVIPGHCDCMLFVNTYRWDFDKVMALCAPRPLLLGNSDRDDLFPVGGYRRPAAKVKRIYDLYGASDRFALCETAGGHVDTPEIRQGAYAWMNRWLRQDAVTTEEIQRPLLSPQQLKVLQSRPDDAINASVHETFRKPARLELPRSPEVARVWWQGKAAEIREGLRTQVFGGWPVNPPPLQVQAAEDLSHGGLRLRAFDFQSEDEVELRLWLLTADKVARPSLVVLTAVDEEEWQEWVQTLGPVFRGSLQLGTDPRLNEKRFEQMRRMLTAHPWAMATIAPRGIGPTRWSSRGLDSKAADAADRRRFVMLGQTLDGQRVWDIRRAVQAMETIGDFRNVPLWLQGHGDMAALVLYAALFEPSVQRLDLWHPPPSHDQGPTFLNVRSLIDMPQAMALALPRQIRVYVQDKAEGRAWQWPLELQALLGQKGLLIQEVGPERIAAPRASP